MSHFPGLGIEDSSRKPWADAGVHRMLAWDPVRSSRSPAYPHAFVLRVLIQPDVKRSAILSFDHLFLTGNGVGETEAFPNLSQVWPAFSESLLGYLSAISLSRECCMYSRSFFSSLTLAICW